MLLDTYNLNVHAGHKHIKPKAIHDKDIVDEFSKDYIYLACIQFVDSVCCIFLVLYVLYSLIML